ncbi:hypothetical protein OUZ56_011270 [Daphnia magna]|uniref:Uncharacterized protein n=1 Tax=Daphnia magna TaxID=35525 RepID=A0ABQ9Z0X2_9CRUS|nr:hypothetical protein OUZ56_011270 [Daphnia magna]
MREVYSCTPPELPWNNSSVGGNSFPRLQQKVEQAAMCCAKKFTEFKVLTAVDCGSFVMRTYPYAQVYLVAFLVHPTRQDILCQESKEHRELSFSEYARLLNSGTLQLIAL